MLDVQRRLLLWADRTGRGLARVEYSSEFSRQQILQSLKSDLAERDITLTVIELPTQRTAPEVVQFLLKTLANVPDGVISVSGFSSAFQAHSHVEDSLRIVNFNREALTAFPLRQIWWMTPVLLQTSLHAMPDLHGWFSPQLTLAQPTSREDSSTSRELITRTQLRNSNFDDARQRSRQLLVQLEAAQSAGATDIDLATTYLLPALESLAEVGAQKEVRHLTTQYEELLNLLENLDAVTEKNKQHSNIANSLNSLARLYYLQGLYDRAKPLFIKALEINRTELGDRHPDTATSLNNLALLYESQGRYGAAEPLYVQALEISKAELGDRHPNTATSLNNLALLYESQGRYGEAEPLLVQALEIRKTELGDRHPDTATSLNDLAGLYKSQGRYGEAEPLYVQALEIYKAELGDRHPDAATSLNNLAGLYKSQGRYGEAEPLYVQALEISKAELGDRHPDTAGSLFNLAALYHQTQRHQQALSYIQQALDIYRPTLGSEHPTTQSAHSWLLTIQQAIDSSQ
ncbi:MAG: tetratricopeptide repeat-containing protein [Leptolyngbya foveolarum]|uniref:Tetratricopeptide repeat-containing protein n=1 Tax=Leptolyngbya foveolarum TaxID=47253 RepID=A0A2W4VTP2_9CYAN|nr:MAG: tetratricopeptide repeat-containing protein [Leptolyngbya foveolarum]